jgi:uncharacterized protein with HEPN domain
MLNLITKLIFPRGFGKKTISQQTQQKIKQDWQNIAILIKGKSPSQLQKALLTADKTLDSALRDLVPGETMGERLKNAKDKYAKTTYDKIWKAHKLRNMTVHETNFEAPHYVITEAITDLKKGIETLGIKI